MTSPLIVALATALTAALTPPDPLLAAASAPRSDGDIVAQAHTEVGADTTSSKTIEGCGRRSGAGTCGGAATSSRVVGM
jgi:hypothetical protein